jgi:hypothetical protein
VSRSAGAPVPSPRSARRRPPSVPGARPGTLQDRAWIRLDSWYRQTTLLDPSPLASRPPSHPIWPEYLCSHQCHCCRDDSPASPRRHLRDRLPLLQPLQCLPRSSSPHRHHQQTRLHRRLYHRLYRRLHSLRAAGRPDHSSTSVSSSRTHRHSTDRHSSLLHRNHTPPPRVAGSPDCPAPAVTAQADRSC